MKRRFVLFFTVILVLFALQLDAQKVHVKGYVCKDGTVVQPYDRSKPGTKSGTGAGTTTGTTTSTTQSKPLPAAPSSGTVERDQGGHIKRTEAQKHEFMKQTGYPNGRPGYVVDHIVPLACGVRTRRATCSGRP